MSSKEHDLFDFMMSTTNSIAEEYNRIQKRVNDDPGTAGDQGEENWAELLRDWLPGTYQVVTKGRILSQSGIAGPQIDVLVLNPNYPRKFLDKKLYLAAGVVAAFECKITLNAGHISKAVQNAVEIQRECGARNGSPYEEICSPILYGVLSHSHIWKGKQSTPIENINKHLTQCHNSLVSHPREELDLICVADLATWTIMKMFGTGKGSELFLGGKGGTVTGYVSADRNKTTSSFTPPGSMIYYLWRHFAHENVEIRPIAQYLQAVGLKGSPQGTVRGWNPSIYSDNTQRQLRQGRISDTSDVWNYWNERLLV